MVLAATSSDHSVVRVIEAPATASAGDRVTYSGHTGEVASSTQMAKKKIWEKLSPDLRTNESGIVCFRGIPVTVGIL
jgi:hypothetical protein